MNKFYIKYSVLILFLCLIFPGYGQEKQEENIRTNEGRIYIYWGYNRGYYSKSDIHLLGTDYDFVLYDVIAKDRQTAFSIRNYFHPERLTIPQTNFGIGYYLKNNFIATLSLDHMKYVVQQEQEVLIEGEISREHSEFFGNYNKEAIKIQPHFFRMEHTDGLNYVSAGITRSDNIFYKINKFKNKLELYVNEGFEAGVLVPRTDVAVLGGTGRNKYYLSGFGASIKAGTRLVAFRNYFINVEMKGGYISLSNILTSQDKTEKARQDFWFFQKTFQFGGIFYLRK